MAEASPKVIVIPAKPEAVKEHAARHQLRVAAYCRVSTDDEEQLTSYEAQKTYYGYPSNSASKSVLLDSKHGIV